MNSLRLRKLLYLLSISLNPPFIVGFDLSLALDIGKPSISRHFICDLGFLVDNTIYD